MDLSRLNRALFLKCARVLALGGLASLVLVMVVGSVKSDLDQVLTPFAGISVGLFFTGVAAYALALGLNLESSDYLTPTALDTWEQVPAEVAGPYEAAEVSYLSSQLGLWAAVIFGFVLAITGAASFGDVGGYVGFALGALCVLIAVAILVRAFVRMVAARAAVWVHLRRHRWQLGLYLLGCLALGFLWFEARRWLHVVNLGYSDGLFVVTAMIAFRSWWRSLW